MKSVILFLIFYVCASMFTPSLQKCKPVMLTKMYYKGKIIKKYTSERQYISGKGLGYIHSRITGEDVLCDSISYTIVK